MHNEKSLQDNFKSVRADLNLTRNTVLHIQSKYITRDHIRGKRDEVSKMRQ